MEKTLKAFTRNLPDNPDSYFQILNSTESSLMRSGLVTLKSGESVGEHSTSDYEEMLIILNGSGTVEINNGESFLKVEKGQIAYIPPGTVHNVTNNNISSLRYIYVVSKAEKYNVIR
ncbi:MAG: cupin domain-containing protein [Ignavibacteria bacterium]|nr:cupin domain-containing protein [Ignavibacteria bacterium]